MTYEEIAEELLSIHARLKRLEMSHQMDGYSKGEVYGLAYLYEHGGCAYPKDMSKGMMISSARVAVILNHLEEKGWIIRSPDTKDTRQTIVTLTESGIDAIREDKSIRIRALTETLEKLGMEDAETMLRIRKRMLEEPGNRLS